MRQSAVRPARVTILGWLYLVAAVLTVLSGAMGWAAFTVIREHAGGNAPLWPPSVLGRLLFQHFGELTLAQIAIASFVGVAAVQFLRLRPWARAVLEGATWFTLAYTLAFGVFWELAWTHGPWSAPETPTAFLIVGAIMGIAITVAIGGVVGMLLWLLRSETVRQAMINNRRTD